MVPVPPFTCLLRDLAPDTNYSLRVRCTNALGPSPYADWVPFRTKGLGKGLTEQTGWAGLERRTGLAPVLGGVDWERSYLRESFMHHLANIY